MKRSAGHAIGQTAPEEPPSPEPPAPGLPDPLDAAFQLLYLNSGSALSASLVAPGSTIFFSCICSELNGTTTYFVPIPRKPPTDNMA